MNIKMIEGAKAIGEFIEGIAKRGKKLDGDIHVAACSATAHFAAHGDVTYINRLYLAMPKGARHVALTEWFLQFAGVVANDGSDKKNNPFLKDKTEGGKGVNLDEGVKKPWFMLKPSKGPDEVPDLLALTLKVIAKAKKANEDGGEVENLAMLEGLQALAEQFSTKTDELIAEEQGD